MIGLGESAQAAPSAGPTLSGNPSRIGGFSDLEEYTTTHRTTETRNPKPYALPNAQRPRMTDESCMVTPSKTCVRNF